MTRERLQDICMQIATGNLTTTCLTYDEFLDENMDITEHAWEPFDYMNKSTYNELILVEYETILAVILPLNQQLEAAHSAMQTFVDRVEKGEVKSTRTYNQFKQLLSGEAK